jgi:predicted acylesterase/phospholipase RssA
MTKINYYLVMSILAISISGCSSLPYGASFNKRAETMQAETVSQTSFVVRRQREAKTCTDGVVRDPKRNKNVLVMLALSGGGSRAAYFSALSMLEMQNIDLMIGGLKSDVLHEVDVISSVSGGSLAAAYYAVSHDPGNECAGHFNRPWNKAQIRRLMTMDYRWRWLGRWFWPQNIARYWLTKYDRTDIMSQVFADKLFDKITGFDLTLGELNQLRPNLILNATTGVEDEPMGIRFGDVFTFTTEDFTRICSSIEKYSVAHAVMATAAFPGVFNFVTLRNYCWKESAGASEDRRYQNVFVGGSAEDRSRASRRYLHVFDGGNADNLGLTSLKRVIWGSLKNHDTQPSLPYKNVIVILVDAYTDYHGVDPREADPRGTFDFIMDTNFMDATNCLLSANRKRLLDEFEQGHANLFPFAMESDGTINKRCRDFFHNNDDTEKYCRKTPAYWEAVNKAIRDKLMFVHLSFDRVGDVEGCMKESSNPGCLRYQLNRIPTDFRLNWSYGDDDTGLTDSAAIACAVPTLFGRYGDSCGKLLPKPSRDLPPKWERVKQILQQPMTEDLSSPDQPNDRLRK